MARFYRVEGDRAGPTALGILIPPGRQTLVVLRPRALDWDLVLLRPGNGSLMDPGFWEVARDRAGTLAEEILNTLESSVGLEPASARVVRALVDSRYEVRVAVGALGFALCERVPGQPYRPVGFDFDADAREAVARLIEFLCPATADLELYFNSQNFSR